MKTSKLIEVLDSNGGRNLHLMLPSGDFVPEHFHVTEIGRVHKTFIDCGGILRESAVCVLQAWTAHDVEHRLSAGKLSGILKLADAALASNDLEVHVEYGEDVAAQYVLADVVVADGGVLFVLTGKKTDCLAPDKCGVDLCCKNSKSSKCC
jgi:hypothetical protein